LRNPVADTSPKTFSFISIENLSTPIAAATFVVFLLSQPSHTTLAPMASQAPPSSTGSVQLDALKQTVAAKSPAKLSGIDLYSRFAFAGAVCCSVTHGALTPVDV
jgi:hypothetical protein